MIKVIVHIAKAVIAVVIAFLFASCGFGGKHVEGSGNVTTQNRNITAAFTAIDAGNGLDVYIEQGDKQSVIVEADDNLQGHIKTELHGDKLEITSDVNTSSNATKRVTVTIPVIKNIEVSSGASVKSKTVIKSDDLELLASSGANLEATVNTKRLACDSSSDSNIKVSGKTENLKTDSSSGSNIDAKELVANSVKADSSSGSSTVVNAVQSLNANASSGASVNYIKTPNELTKKADSGGSVSQN